jgi:hypothetical protein
MMEDGRGRGAEDRGQVSEVRVLTWLIGVDFKYFFCHRHTQTFYVLERPG